jgi:hypothetical protein
MYKIGIADLFNPLLHGGENREYLKGKFLFMDGFDFGEIEDGEHYDYLHGMKMAHSRIHQHEYNPTHKDQIFQLKLLKIEEYPTGETVCVDKTHYIKILQRRIRNRYN